MKKAWLTGMIFSALCMANTARSQAVFSTKHWMMSLDKTGKLTSMKRLSPEKEFLVADSANALLRIQHKGKLLSPQTCVWKPKQSELQLSYAENITAIIKVKMESSYLSFELEKLNKAEEAELVLWGPFPNSIGDTIGEVVGVVRSKDFALGIQALNVKTLGGYPNADSDIEPSYDIFEKGNKVDVTGEDIGKQLFRGDVARPTSYGSVLQAYCRNRHKDRIINNWGHTNYLAPAFDDGGVTGSKIALFGVPVNEVMNTLSQIEMDEGLPHPMLDGVWGKQAARASESYLIMDFGVNNLQEALNVTKQAGLRYLYHGDPFENWGHFTLKKKDFPQNWASLRQSVSDAAQQNIRLGVHTLSNFITTNDPYVTPVPDKRLAKVGYATLTENIDAQTKEITISSPVFFNQFQNNTLKSVVVGDEIIRYAAVSTEAPWKLLNCQRAAFGTRAATHEKNDSIGKLMDHPYQVFLTNASLQEEMAKTIAKLFNETGLMQISFDGLEGCWSSGMGQYARQLFTKTWYDNLKPELKGKVINDASNPGHFFWHIYTRMNWGEPWYAGFRESQLQLRLKNQQFYRRNLMPSMLGWFSLRPETAPEDIEWMLALGAGYQAGFGLSTSLETIKKHGRTDEIFSMIKRWEKVRLAHVFTEEQEGRMRSLKTEFHLDSLADKRYALTTVYNAYYHHKNVQKQPGEPTFSRFVFANKGEEQPLRFILNPVAANANTEISITNPSFTINQQDVFVVPVTVKQNQVLYCDGNTIKVYTKQWKLVETVGLTKPLPKINAGENQIIFNGQCQGEDSEFKIELRAMGEKELIRLLD
ncbi:MAG: hypothetical protein V4539_00925 [Bacteroidota bacterium]